MQTLKQIFMCSGVWILAGASWCGIRVNFEIDPSSQTTAPVVSRMLYGMNVARWDHQLFPSTSTQSMLPRDEDAIAKLRALRPAFLKYPGGNDADNYVWSSPENPGTDMDSEEFLQLAKAGDAPGFITVNFRAGPRLAADWVQFFKKRGKKLGVSVPFWEVGDEVWGPWAKSHTTGANYAKKFREFSVAMRAVDPKLKLAANLALSDPDSSWTQQAIANLGDSFDIVTMTYFPQSPPHESDEKLFASPERYRTLFRKLESAVARAYPNRPRPKYCLVGFNSTSFGPGPQTVEMANGVFMAQMFGALAETGTDMACWWAFHNAYPKRGGDFGVLTSDAKNDPHYTFGVFEMLSRFFHGKLISVKRAQGVECYAVYNDKQLEIMLINTHLGPVEVALSVPRNSAGKLAHKALEIEDSDQVTSGATRMIHVSQERFASITTTKRSAASEPAVNLPPYSVTVVHCVHATLR